MAILEITLQRKSVRDETWPVVMEAHQPQGQLPLRSEGRLALDLDELNRLSDPRTYGIYLGEALFQGSLRDAFVRAQSGEADGDRVLLFVEAAELRGLRWERLCAPFDGNWDFLLLNQRAPFSLYLPSLTMRRFAAIGRRDLRALVVIASPGNLSEFSLDTFDEAATLAGLEQSLGAIPFDVLAGPEVPSAVGLPTLQNLSRRLTEQSYSLLHVVAHGRVSRRRGEALLYLSDNDYQVDAISTTQLIERLGRLPAEAGLPHFAFLATCESAVPQAADALGGLAQGLVQELGLPAVLAMTERITLRTAEALAAEFYTRLQSHGYVDLALAEVGNVLAERDDVTVPALYSRLGGQPLFSQRLDRPLTVAEMEHGLQRLADLLQIRAPVLQDEFVAWAAALRATLTQTEALSVEAQQEQKQTLAHLNQLSEEAVGITFPALALDQAVPPYDERCPFPGLFPFRQENSAFFFGREPLVQQLQAHLADDPFLAVLGASGSGKSSLVMAGLIPALQAAEPALQPAILTPGTDPSSNLEAALKPLNDTPPAARLLVVDQFEEAFTLTTDVDQRDRFFDQLLTLAETQRVIITMRADFWGACAEYLPLRDRMQRSQQLIGPMTETELRRAMEQQAALVGLRFEANLSNMILDDVRDEPGAMPLLQHALRELWLRRHGRWLSAAEYEALGGVQKAIAETADKIYDQLRPRSKARMRDIFVRLTRIDENAVQGVARRDTRRRIGLGELFPANRQTHQTEQLIQTLTDARLLVTSVNPLSRETEVEVAHEALIRHWPRLRGWLDEDLADLRILERVRQAALTWHDAPRQSRRSLLVHRGKTLDEALRLMNHPRFTLNEVEQAYLQECQEARDREEKLQADADALELDALGLIAETQRQRARERRQRQTARRQREAAEAQLRRQEQEARERELAQAQERAAEQAQAAALLRRRAFVLTVVGVAAIALAVLAGLLYWQAQLNAQEAIEQQQISQAQRLAAEALSRLDTEFDLAMLLMLEANDIRRGPETSEGLLLGVIHHPHLMTFLHGHRGQVGQVAFSPNGQLLASGDSQGQIRLWDVTTAQMLGEPLAEHGDTIGGLAFSPDGQLLASSDAEGRILLWNVSGRSILAQSFDEGHTDAVWQLAFSPNGQTLASAGGDGQIILWDLSGNQELGQSLRGHDRGVNAIAFSPNGQTLASGGDDRTVVLWDVSGGQPRAFLTGHTGWVSSVAYSPDGQILASAGGDGTIRLWDAITGDALSGAIQAHDGPITGLVFSPNGQVLASAGWDQTLRLWNPFNGRPLDQPLTGHGTSVFSLDFSPTGDTLASGGSDGQVILWRVSRQQQLAQPLQGHNNWVDALAFSPDGQTLASGSWDNAIILWDVLTGERRGSPLLGHSAPVTSLAFDPAGEILVSGGDDGQLYVWDMTTNVARAELGVEGSIQTLSVSPDGQMLVAGGTEGTILRWDLQTLRAITPTITAHSASLRRLAFSPDGTTLASAGDDGAVRLWNLNAEPPTSRQVRGLSHSAPVTSLAFSPDGTQLASGSEDKAVILWDVATGQALIPAPWVDHQHWVSDLAFSPNGDILVSASWDYSIRLRDVQTGEAYNAPLVGHRDIVLSLAFSPDGRTLASGGGDNTVLLWDLDVQSWRERICHRVNRSLTETEWQQFFNSEPPSALNCASLAPTVAGQGSN